MPLLTDPVTLPWSTGFEEGFCDYTKVAGYCYGDQPYVLVTEPHRPGGRFAAEFNVVGTESDAASAATDAGVKPFYQTRCVRQGVLPESAFYGAYYYIPEAPKDAALWNLFHFQGGESPDDIRKLWDVTLVKIPQSEDWELVVFDPLGPPNNNTYRPAEHKRVPIGSWFHIELFLKRATDSTGEIRLYQDSALLVEKTNLRSDLSKFTQWYVGDLVDNTPLDSRLYVDDLSISATPSSASATQ